MTERRALFIQGASHSAEEVRLLHSAIFGGGLTYDAESPAIGAFARGHGIVRGFGVTPNGTPNNTVHVAGGIAVVRGTQENDQGHYIIGADGSEQLTLGAADATNPRRDLIVAKVRDAQYPAFAGDDWQLEIIPGTPAGSPVDPAVPEDSLAIARVRVHSLATENPMAIDLGQIDSLSPQVRAVGGITPVNVAADLPDPAHGDVVDILSLNALAIRRISDWRMMSNLWIAQGGAPWSIVAGTLTVFTVSYGVTFTAIPRVTATVEASTGGTFLRIGGITTTQFDVAVEYGAGVTASGTVHWNAIGTRAAP